MPNFATGGQRPITEEERRRLFPEIWVNPPALPPLTWDNRETFPVTPEIALQFEEQRQRPLCTTMSPIVMSREELAAQGRCLDGSYLTPYCKCDGCRFQPTYPPYFDPIWLAYIRQIRQSHCFDIDDHPGSPVGASVGLLAPSHDFSGEAELLMELAKRAILEYNEKECNVFKYKVLKIEKVNYTVTAYYQYWMTVKVLNLTLSTPIETFQVHAHKSILIDDDEEVTYCCRPKEEEIEHLISSSARTRTQVVVGVKFNSSALLDRREVVLLRGSNNFSVTAITTSHGRGSSVVPTLKIIQC